jgi:hypothetical protein
MYRVFHTCYMVRSSYPLFCVITWSLQTSVGTSPYPLSPPLCPSIKEQQRDAVRSLTEAQRSCVTRPSTAARFLTFWDISSCLLILASVWCMELCVHSYIRLHGSHRHHLDPSVCTHIHSLRHKARTVPEGRTRHSAHQVLPVIHRTFHTNLYLNFTNTITLWTAR